MMAMSNYEESLDEKKLECSTSGNRNTDQIPKSDKMKCVCEKDEQANIYCLDCRLYLCSTCSDHHTKFPVMQDHRPMVASEIQLCMIHSEYLEFYCVECKIPICEKCTQADHRDTRGKHKTIKIQKAFQNFKESARDLEDEANGFLDNLKKGVTKVLHNDKKLEESKATCMKHIENSVQELISKINENEDERKKKVENIYKKKKKVNNMQLQELKMEISNVDKLLSAVNQLINSDEIIAMKSSNMVYKALRKNLDKSPKTEPNDDGQIYFFKNVSLLQFNCDIGNVTETMADHLALIGGDVTEGQKIVVKVCKTDEYEIDADLIRATWTYPNGKTKIAQVKEDGNKDLVVSGKCTIPGICTLDVSIDGKAIRQSPMSIKVEKAGLVRTIQIQERMVSDVVLYDDDLMLVSCRTNCIFKYTQSAEYIDKIKFPNSVKVNRMHKAKNGIVAFSDYGKKCITLIRVNGTVIKTIGENELRNPKGLHVDESVVYVADENNICVFNIDNCQMIRSVQQEHNVPDINVTKGGNVIVLYDQNIKLKFQNTKQCILQVLDNQFKSLYEIVKTDVIVKPRGVAVDADGNIIIASEHKLELFSNDGSFIKRIDKFDDGINIPWGMSVANNPRRVAVANKGNATIQIYNY